MKKLSIGVAIAIGTLWVNIPVLPLMFAPVTAYFLSVNGPANRQPTGLEMLLAFGLFCFGLTLAWSWWSLMIPQWRLWAWARVENLAGLKVKAIQAGLIWPDGHFFEKTEFRSETTRARLKELESRAQADA
jgi:hypothetical protein